MLKMSGRLVGNRYSDDWLNKVVQSDCNLKIWKLIYNTNEMYIIYSKSIKKSFWGLLREGNKSIKKTVNNAPHYLLLAACNLFNIKVHDYYDIQIYYKISFLHNILNYTATPYWMNKLNFFKCHSQQ